MRLVQRQIQGLECSVCGQIVDSRDVRVGSLVLLLARLKEERFALCPSCTREVPPDLQRDTTYCARWNPFVKEMLKALKRGVKWHQFRPKL